MKKKSNSQVFDTYFTQPEEKQLFAFIKRHGGVEARRDLAWMQLARFSAVRVCVLSGLTVGDALEALRHERLRIRPEINKGSKQQDLYASKSICQTLRALVKIHKETSCESDWPDTPFHDRPLILSRNHRGMSIRSFQSRMQYWCKAAGVPVGSPHWFRHTWAKRQVQASDDVARTLMRVQAFLGHEDLKTTTIYTLPDKEEMVEFGRYAV